MTGIYYTELADILVAAGLYVGESAVNAGWQERARSSGGFPAPGPLGVVWHHTASSTTPENDLTWQCHTCDDAPVGNMLIDRDGVVWPVAAGASNCAGKGGPWTFSRGTVPVDQGNTRLWQIEVACDGVGGAYSEATMNAWFTTSNTLNAHCGNRPDDVITHAAWTYYTRKIDPATAAAVLGPWRPSSLNSSGTWDLDDIAAECVRRAGAAPPRPPIGDDMPAQVIKGDGSDRCYGWNGAAPPWHIPDPQWIAWGFEAGLYSNVDPVVYPQGFIDQIVSEAR